MFEEYRQPVDPDRCDLCGSTDGLMVFDGQGYGPDALDEPGTDVNLCTTCQAWAYQTRLAAEYGQEDD